MVLVTILADGLSSADETVGIGVIEVSPQSAPGTKAPIHGLYQTPNRHRQFAVLTKGKFCGKMVPVPWYLCHMVTLCMSFQGSQMIGQLSEAGQAAIDGS
jgi:hypothetical protein